MRRPASPPTPLEKNAAPRNRAADARSRPVHWNPPLKARTLIFFGAFALVFYLRLTYQATYFPPYFEGEEANVIDSAKATYDFAVASKSWVLSFTSGFFEYNKGYYWALVPFYAHFGYDVRLIPYILPVFFSIFCAAFFTLYRKVYPKSSLLSFALVAVFSVLCLSLRRYKWHSVSYLAAISVYLYFLPLFNNGATFLSERWRKGLAVLLFVVSCYFYFGCFLYALPFLALVFFFSRKAERRRELVLAGIACVLFVAAFFAAYHVTNLWGVRIRETLVHAMKGFSRQGLLSRWWATRDFFFSIYLSGPFQVILWVGLVASFRKIRRGDRFALVNTTLLLYLWVFETFLEGINNPDQLNWSMIPILGTLLIGANEILVPIRDKVRGGPVICAALVLLAGWHEMRFYLPMNRDAFYQPYVQTHNTRTQAALVLRMIRDDDSGTAQYYLPDPKVDEAHGGFDYSVSLMRVDYIKALSKVIFFTSEEDLRKRLLSQVEDKWAVVYLSVGIPPPDAKDTSETALLGQAPQIIHPFEDVYGIPYVVRRFHLRPGLSRAQVAGGLF